MLTSVLSYTAQVLQQQWVGIGLTSIIACRWYFETKALRKEIHTLQEQLYHNVTPLVLTIDTRLKKVEKSSLKPSIISGHHAHHHFSIKNLPFNQRGSHLRHI